MKPRILFVCIHNSARSQMAEAFLKRLSGDAADVRSAGLEAGTLNQYAVRAMRDIDIDISANRTKTVADPEIANSAYDYVVTVCEESKARSCPVVPVLGARMAWYFEDPSGFRGTDDERMRRTREVRDAIQRQVSEWYASLAP